MSTDNGKAAREYVVLMADAQDLWHSIGTGHGATAKAAVASVVEKLPKDEQEGTFVAVPRRSWQPLTRRTETITKALWSS